MDSTTEKDNSPEAIRERVESKQDEYAGGSEPGWQTMEAAVDDTRHQAAQEWSGDSSGAAPESTSGAGVSGYASGQQPVGDVSSSGYGSAGQPSGGTGDFGSGATSHVASSSGVDTADGNSGSTTSARDAEVADVPSSPEHPVGVGQQCFKCGAYNDIDAETCWNCSEKLTHSMTETPGVVESVETASAVSGTGAADADADAEATVVADADANADVVTGSRVTDEFDTTTDSDSSGGARPLSP